MIIENNRQALHTHHHPMGIGLNNINEHYLYLFKQGIDIYSTHDLFTIKLPLKMIDIILIEDELKAKSMSKNS